MIEPGDAEMIALTGAVYVTIGVLKGVYSLKVHKKICYMDSIELLEFADKLVVLESILDMPDMIQQKISLVKILSVDLRKAMKVAENKIRLWQDIATEDQKGRLIDAVVDEIEKLQRNLALKGLLGDIELGSYSSSGGTGKGDTKCLKITGGGELLEDDSFYRTDILERVFENNKPVDVARLRYLIMICRITPDSIKLIRGKIER